MVFVTSIDDVQLCMVSIYMQGFPLACGLRQPGSKWLQAGFRFFLRLLLFDDCSRWEQPPRECEDPRTALKGHGLKLPCPYTPTTCTSVLLAQVSKSATMAAD